MESQSTKLHLRNSAKHFKEMYPLLHQTLKCEIVKNRSLLYTWEGTRPELKPILIMAHQDVVPVDPDSLSTWTHPPFSGEIADGYIWGRGALDIKSQVVAALETVELFLKEGFHPQRTLYLAFGEDEEVGGLGAQAIVELLKSRNVRLATVVDEGGLVMKDFFPGVTTPVAMVGVAEKGYLTLKLTAEGTPGHSSTPPTHTAIGILAEAITRIEAAPLPADINVSLPMYRSIGSELPFKFRLVLANLWLLGGLAEAELSKKPTTNAGIRTTTAVTIIQGGIKDNIIPG